MLYCFIFNNIINAIFSGGNDIKELLTNTIL